MLDGPFYQARERCQAYLLSLDPDRLLHTFRVNTGLPAKAAVYGGWESDPTWTEIHCQDHTLGHYLSACALIYGAKVSAIGRLQGSASVGDALGARHESFPLVISTVQVKN